MKLDSRAFMLIVLVCMCVTVLIAVGRVPLSPSVMVVPTLEVKEGRSAAQAPVQVKSIVYPPVPRGLVPPPPPVPVFEAQ